jgi:hypothetical protein
MVRLMEDDVFADDPLATVVVQYSDLVAALRAGNVYSVDVHAQDSGQLLFVNIFVRAS